MVDFLEALIFKIRLVILAGLGVFILCAGFYAVQWKRGDGLARQLPLGHEYTRTFQDYREELFGSNRIIVVLERRDQGPIWTKEFFTRYKQITDDILNLPGVARHTVRSLWTPNARYLEITEEGISADSVIDSHVSVGMLDEAELGRIKTNVRRGGFIGHLVAEDSTAAMITAEFHEDRAKPQARPDYLDLARKLETGIRRKYEDKAYSVRIIGAARLAGDIAGAAPEMIFLFLAAFLVTALVIYFYLRSFVLALLPVFCSGAVLVWQCGALSFLGYGLDLSMSPVLFLVFAIGISHGVQRVNLIADEMSAGSSVMEAARSSFRGLLIPGALALLTTMIAFGTLLMNPIPLIGDLAIAAMLGIAFTVVANLIMLPVLASYARFGRGHVPRLARAREGRRKVMRLLGRIANPGAARIAVLIAMALLAGAIIETRDRPVGAAHPGSPMLYAEARYNVDAKLIADKFPLDNLLIIVNETPPEACIQYRFMEYLNQFSWYMQNVDGVSLVLSLPYAVKTSSSGWNESNLKWKDIPRNQFALVQAVGPVPPSSGLLNQNCSVLPIQVFLEDAKASTIKKVTQAAKDFRAHYPMEGVHIRLASGNMGVQAAIDDEIDRSEWPMMLWVYMAIASLVILTYRDWRAVIVCCAPLALATFLGYWLLKEWQIALTVRTLPVMALAAGLGVDYVFYVYHRLQTHLAAGLNVTDASKKALCETGIALLVAATALSAGIGIWTGATLKFPADMGVLLAFMLMANMIMAVLALPALAVTLDMLVPRRKPVKAPPGAQPRPRGGG